MYKRCSFLLSPFLEKRVDVEAACACGSSDIDFAGANDVGQMEPIKELYPLEPMIEPYELDLIGDIDPLAEEGIEVL